MPGISSRIGTWAIARQTAKGTPVANPTNVYYLRAAPSLAPTKVVETLPMTDAQRDPGKNIVSRIGVEGDVPIYANVEGIGLLFYGALGANANSGAGPNYTHTITPASDTPWFTMWRMVGNVIYERFVDCKINGLTLEGAAGGALGITLSVIGIKAEKLAGAFTGTPLFCSEFLFAESDTFHKVATVARPIDRLTWGVTNNGAPWQANAYRPEDIDVGNRDWTLDWGQRFNDAAEYHEHFYGAGTDQVTTIPSKAWEVEFRKTAVQSLKIAHAGVSYREYPVQPDPAGDPIGVGVSAAIERQTTAAGTCTVTVLDQNATL
jgi:hypothetical protein